MPDIIKNVILNVYKPKNWTSFDVVAKLRGILKTKKIGHAGTLDPLAEGVLIVLTDKDTKKQNELMHTEKEYIAEIVFGVESPTYDWEGPLRTTKEVPTKEEVFLKIPSFVGEIEQKVPAYSAVKVEGKRLYKSARQNKIKENELPVRKVFIYEIQVISFGEQEFEINSEKVKRPVLKCLVRCSSGTYIRSLAHDLGGVLSSLVRTRVGPFKSEDSKTLEALSQ